MPRASKNKLQLSEEEKKKRRREQKKMSMRRARAKLDIIAIEERRKKDRERYHRKKQEGSIKTIRDFTPRQQRQMRKMWREKSKIRREKEKIEKRTAEILIENTPPSSPSSSRASLSRIAVGKAIRLRNRRQMKARNQYLVKRLDVLERRLAKYRMRLFRMKKNKEKVNTIKLNLKQKIHDFLNDDENSRLTAGKKETITRRKVKKQIRLLNDTLLNLHKKFNNTTGLNISYETFRRYRPFWVVFPKAASRNTCLCSLHTNTDYIVCALRHAKVISFNSATDLAKSLCCNNALNISCLERKSSECSENRPNYTISNGEDTVIYQRWTTKNFQEVIKGKEKICKKTIKESVKTSQQNLVDILNKNLTIFMQHIANILNQHRAVRFIKENLTTSEGLLHIDFSENYSCKYASEVQSAHFGGSKSQLSLHTCVYYFTNSDPPKNFLKTSSICTVSENLRHDPVFICAHLFPVIEKIKLLTPDLKKLHILSDGPTTQYRNKTMFNLIATYLREISNTEAIIWHFSEAGHGKGAPDGIGGCVKRTCDNVVANGKDISSISQFINCLQESCKGIQIIKIDESNVPRIQTVADSMKCRPFKGTFQIHQVAWSVTDPTILHARRLSCVTCAEYTNCPHFEIGQIQVPLVSHPSEALSHVPSSSSSEILVPSPASHRTASASTISAPPSPVFFMVTPSPEPSENYLQPITPRKRILTESNHSNDSITPPKKSRVLSTFFDSSDECDENIF